MFKTKVSQGLDYCYWDGLVGKEIGDKLYETDQLRFSKAIEFEKSFEK